MRIGLGSDHRGFELKSKLIDYLQHAGHECLDFGCYSLEAVDYPDFAVSVSQSVVKIQSECGILICGSGIGMCIAANKIKGIRAATCYTPDLALRARKHNNANILCLGSDFIDYTSAIKITHNFIHTQFEGGRHQRRLDKISAIESFKQISLP